MEGQQTNENRTNIHTPRTRNDAANHESSSQATFPFVDRQTEALAQIASELTSIRILIQRCISAKAQAIRVVRFEP
jgi:hypothetical protein